MVAAGHMKRVSRARCDFSRGAVSSGVKVARMWLGRRAARGGRCAWLHKQLKRGGVCVLATKQLRVHNVKAGACVSGYVSN